MGYINLQHLLPHIHSLPLEYSMQASSSILSNVFQVIEKALRRFWKSFITSRVDQLSADSASSLYSVDECIETRWHTVFWIFPLKDPPWASWSSLQCSPTSVYYPAYPTCFQCLCYSVLGLIAWADCQSFFRGNRRTATGHNPSFLRCPTNNLLHPPHSR